MAIHNHLIERTSGLLRFARNDEFQVLQRFHKKVLRDPGSSIPAEAEIHWNQ